MVNKHQLNLQLYRPNKNVMRSIAYNAIGRVRPSVRSYLCFYSIIFQTSGPLTCITARALTTGYDSGSPGILKVRVIAKVRGQCKHVCLTFLSTTAFLWATINGRISGFHSNDVFSCELARRGVWRGAAEISGSGRVQRVGVVTRSVWPRSSIDSSFYSL